MQKPADRVVTGMRGIRVTPESKERDRLAFACMSNGISSERQVETAVRQTAALIEHSRAAGHKIIAVAGPVVVHTGGAPPLSKLIREGYINSLLSGNALGVHDIENALLGTSLGIRQSDGRQEEHGHRNHMRAINAIYHAGGIDRIDRPHVVAMSVFFLAAVALPYAERCSEQRIFDVVDAERVA